MKVSKYNNEEFRDYLSIIKFILNNSIKINLGINLDLIISSSLLHSLKEVSKYIDNKVIKHIATVLPTPSTILNAPPMYQEMGDRIPRRIHRKLEKTNEGKHREIDITLRYMDAMGIDYNVLFPSPMLNLGLHPLAEIEVEMSRAYNRWLVENILAEEYRRKCITYNKETC